MFGNIYKNRKVLVTGHTGFKGSWLCQWLLGLGADVTGYSLSVPTAPANFEVLRLEAAMRDRRGDIRDRDAVAALFKESAPEIVFHLAAQPLVRESYKDPVGTIETNALGTLYVMDAVRQTPSVKAVVSITSDKCYRNDEWVWGYRETDHLGGSDPYSASKACAEIIAHSCFRSFLGHVRTATVRAGNVIGGGDWAADRIVPDCARAFAAQKPASIRSPWATRPWQHVLEPLSGYLWLGALLFSGQDAPFPLSGEAYNFGPAADVNNTVSEVVDALAQWWPGFSCEMDRNGCAGQKECTLLKLCCDKSLAYLNWKAVLTFAETIRFTAEWYKAYYEGREDMRALTDGQIAQYVERAREAGLPWARK